MAWLFGKKKINKSRTTCKEEAKSVFGSLCYIEDQKLKMMILKSVNIEGTQHNLIFDFKITQTFYNSESNIQETSYLFPNDLKFCIYDTTFIIGEKTIKPKLEPKEEAESAFEEAVESGLTAVYATNIDRGMTQFKLGNVEPNQECKVIMKLALTAQVTAKNKFFIKFPLDIYDPSGSLGCLDVISSNFFFNIKCDKNFISKITSNIANGVFDESQKTFSITKKIENNEREKSIYISFETIKNIESSVLISQSNSNNYDSCAVTIANTLLSSGQNYSEFIFVVDCSGSMSEISITRAAECLDLFIRSLPPNSYFNIYIFGSRYIKLFEKSEKYTESTAKSGIELAQNLMANQGGTNIYNPLSDIFATKPLHGQRQIFIMTDGEDSQVELILTLISNNSKNNRCFTIGIGRGCDAGLVEGMAKESHGKSDFVQEGDLISEKVIPQLNSSLLPLLHSIEIHLEGENNDSFMVSPFPIPPLSANDCSVVYLRKEKSEGENNSPFQKSMLVSGTIGEKNVDFPIEKVLLADENISKAISALFAFNFLKGIERVNNISEMQKKKAIEISISSGVLCKFTAYIGISECNFKDKDKSQVKIEELQKRNDDLNAESKDKQLKAVFYAKQGNIKKAKEFLKRKKAFDERIQLNNQMISNLQLIHSNQGSLKYCQFMKEQFDTPNFDDLQDEFREILDFREAENMIASELEDNNNDEEFDDEINKLLEDFNDDDNNDEMNKLLKEFNDDNDEMNKLLEGFNDDDDKKGDSNKKSESVDAQKNSNYSNDSVSIVKKESDKKFNFIQITQLQKVEGFWVDLDTLNSILGTKVNSIKGVKSNNKVTEKNCVATILAVVALRTKSPNQRSSWMMIEQKAINWLNVQLPGVDIENIIENTSKFI